MDISQSFAKINKIPSPDHEMELVVSIKPDMDGKIQDVKKMESSF